jgi:uncharacterized protein (DUF2344 family)
MIDYNALGQAIDTTWGRYSTPVVNSYSIKISMASPDMLSVSYQTIVNFASEREMILVKRNESEQSLKNIKTAMDIIKKSYSEIVKNKIKEADNEISPKSTLKLKEGHTSDSVEIVGLGVHNPKRTAIYRRKTMFEIG